MSDLPKRAATMLKQILRKLGLRGSEPPADPYAYVGAPKKPKLPGRSASAAAELE